MDAVVARRRLRLELGGRGGAVQLPDSGDGSGAGMVGRPSHCFARGLPLGRDVRGTRRRRGDGRTGRPAQQERPRS